MANKINITYIFIVVYQNMIHSISLGRYRLLSYFLVVHVIIIINKVLLEDNVESQQKGMAIP